MNFKSKFDEALKSLVEQRKPQLISWGGITVAALIPYDHYLRLKEKGLLE